MTQIEQCVSWFSGFIVFTKVHVWATFLSFSTLALKYLLLPWEMQNLEEVLGCRELSSSTLALVHHLCPLSWSQNLGVPPQVYFSLHQCICKPAARPCQVTCSSRNTYPWARVWNTLLYRIHEFHVSTQLNYPSSQDIESTIHSVGE